MTEVQPAARPKPSHSQPEFAKKLRYLQQSDPVDAKELTRRLEICFAEQEQNIERTLRPVRSSSDTSLDGSGPSTPKKKARPFTFHADSIARSLDFNQKKESDGKPIVALNGKKAKRKSAPLLSQGSIKFDKSELRPDEKASKQNIPLPAHSAAARSSRVLDGEAQKSFGQNITRESTKSSEERNRLTSTVSGFLTQDAKAGAARDNAHRISAPPISGAYSSTSSVPSSLPLSFRIPLPTAGESLMDSIQSAQADPNPNADQLSLESASTVTKQRHSVSSSGYPSTTPSSQPPSSPPKPVIQPADKRKSWNMRSFVASRKSKVESSERTTPKSANTVVQGSGVANVRRQSANGVISPHAEVVRAAVNSASTKAEQRKSATAEKTFASRSTPDLLSTNNTPIPLLLLPGEQKRSTSAQQDVRDHETTKKDTMWKRFSLRRTLTDEHDVSKADKAALRNVPTTEDLRSKQLAMRQRAISDSRKPKEEKAATLVSKETSQPKADLLEAQLQELQEQQVRERQRKEQLIEENRQRQMQLEEERRKREIAEAKRQHQLIEERRKQQLAEGMRLQEQRLNELQAQRKAEMEKQEAERLANEQAEREIAQEQERQRLAKEKELQELRAQLQALQQQDEGQSKTQSPAPRSKMHSRGPSAASMKPWAPPPRVSSSRTSISRTPFTPPQASRKPSLVGQIELTTERSHSPRYSLIPASPSTRADIMRIESRKNSVAEIPAEFHGDTSRVESRKNSNTELPKEIPRPPSPFSCPRPPPRIDSLPKKDKPVVNHSRPTSRGTNQSRPTSRGREEMTPRKVTYSNNEKPSAQSLRSRTPSLRHHMPLIGEDGHPTLERSRSSSTARRPKSRSATPSIPADVPEFDPTGLTPESKRLLAMQRDKLLYHKAKSSGSTPTLSQFSTPPPFRRISRFYSTGPPQTAPHSKPELRDVERIPGMTPESVVFLRQQEKLAAERFGWDKNTFTVAPALKRNVTEDAGGLAAERERDKKYKKQNWWKVWRLL